MTITSRQKEVFEAIFEQTGRCESIWIAGGSVVSLVNAGDIDVWFGRGRTDLAKAFLDKLPVKFPTEEGKYGSADGTSQMVGEGWHPGIGKIIQVMSTHKETAAEMMQSFDISTHCWAYTSRGELVKGKYATESTEPPAVLHWTPKTFARYVKICQRYGHQVDMDVLREHQTPKKKSLGETLKSKIHKLNESYEASMQQEMFKVNQYYNFHYELNVSNPSKNAIITNIGGPVVNSEK